MSTLHPAVQFEMRREEELVNAGWGLTTEEAKMHTLVLKAATLWFEFQRMHPQVAQDFLTVNEVADALLPSNFDRR